MEVGRGHLSYRDHLSIYRSPDLLAKIIRKKQKHEMGSNFKVFLIEIIILKKYIPLGSVVLGNSGQKVFTSTRWDSIF